MISLSPIDFDFNCWSIWSPNETITKRKRRENEPFKRFVSGGTCLIVNLWNTKSSWITKEKTFLSRPRLEIPINKQRKRDKKSKLIRNLLVWSVPSRVERDVVLISLYGHQAAKSCNLQHFNRCLVDSKRIKRSERLIGPDTAGHWVQLTDKWRPFKSYPKPGSFTTKLTASSASATADVFLTAECEISII